jgi:hypothetical protein
MRLRRVADEMLRRFALWIAAPEDDSDVRLGGWLLPEWMRVAASTTFLLVVFTLVRHVAMTACRLPEEALAGRWILGTCVARHGIELFGGLAVYLLLVLAVPRLRDDWEAVEGGVPLRFFVGGLAIVLAWSGAGYAYNAWYDQAHLADRAILVVLAALVWWRPAFVFPFVLVYWTLMWQFDFPALGFPVLVAEFKPLAQTLAAFVAVLLVQSVSGRRSMHAFLFLALCLVAANFWIPALAKLKIGWLSHGHLYFLLPNAYTHGWLAFVPSDTIAAVARALATADWPMRLGTILVEGGALLFFANERTASALLVAFTILLGIFLGTIGYFFWKWMLLQLGLLLIVFRPSAAAMRTRLFTRARFIVSLPVIATASYWTAPAALAWFDTPLTNALYFEAVGASGAVYELPPAFFAPYESHIAMAVFIGSLTSQPVLAASYGVTSVRSTADALLTARTPDDIEHLEEAAQRPGRATLDPGFLLTFEAFVRRSASVANRLRDERHWRFSLHPPPFLWTFSRGPAWDGREEIATVRIYRVSSFFDGQHYEVFRRELLSTVAVPPAHR